MIGKPSPLDAATLAKACLKSWRRTGWRAGRPSVAVWLARHPRRTLRARLLIPYISAVLRTQAVYYPDRRDATIWERRMENAGVGWIAAIIIGGLAGWLAEKFMKSEMGLFMNIVLGIVGAAL